MRKASFLLRQNGRLCIIGRNLLQRCILKTSDFYYDLPKELIAQTPAPVRSQSRLLIYNRGDRSITDGVFTDVLDHLHPGDVLVQYTDGVTEATHENQRFGKAGLLSSVNNAPSAKPEQLLDYIRQQIDTFVGQEPQVDDITMMALQYN